MTKHDPVLMVLVGVLDARGARFAILPGGKVGIQHDSDDHLLAAIKGRGPELLAFLKDRASIRENYPPTARAALAIDLGAVGAERLEGGDPFTLGGITFVPGML